MRTILIIISCFSIISCFCQSLPGENFFPKYYFDTYNRYPTYADQLVFVTKFNIKKIHVWACDDSLCAKKQEFNTMDYDTQHRLISESNVEDNNIIPFERYLYNKGEIIYEYNADNLFWLNYKMKLNEKGLITKVKVAGGKYYNYKINYEYSDTFLIRKKIVNCGGEMLDEEEGKTFYEYNKFGKIAKIENDVSKEIELFSYDSTLNMVKYERNRGNINWENEVIKYYYTNNKLTKKLIESFNSGRKDDLDRTETTYFYNDENRLEKEVVKNLKEYTYWIISYKYDVKSLLTGTSFIFSDKKNGNYKLYTYDFY